MFLLKIKTEGAAFRGFDADDREQDAEAIRQETARILKDVAGKVLAGNTHGVVMDTNGNKVCIWSF